MKINIKAKNLTLTPSIEEYIYKKIGSLDKFIRFQQNNKVISEAWIDIAKTTKHHKKGNYFKTSVNLRIIGQKLRAESKTFGMKASIDEVENELQGQLKSYRGKKFAQYLRGARFFKRKSRFSTLAWFKTKKGQRNREEGL